MLPVVAKNLPFKVTNRTSTGRFNLITIQVPARLDGRQRGQDGREAIFDDGEDRLGAEGARV